MAKQLKWKNPEPGVFTSGDFRAVKQADGKWDLWQGGTVLYERVATKKGCQQQAQKQADLYKGNLGTRKTSDRPPFIMFDVKGEISVNGGLINGLVRACGTMCELRAVRVTYKGGGVTGGGGPGSEQVPDVDAQYNSVAWTRMQQICYAVTGSHQLVKMTTVRLIGYPGEWVLALLPLLCPSD